MAANAVTITLAQMDTLLAPQGFVTITVPGTREIVFARGCHVMHADGKLPLSLRIYTSIEDGKSRDVGEDAIRVSLWYKTKVLRAGLTTVELVMLGGSKRVHRVENWRTNLAKRIDAWQEIIQEMQACPRCPAPMRLISPRTGQTWKAFHSCCRYPECKGTAK